MDSKIKKWFIDFLLENNCYSQAQTNFIEQMKVTVEEWLENYNLEAEEILNCGFWWNKSPEGYDYWNDIDELWRTLIEERLY